MPAVVMKFGGTSLGDSERVARAATIVAGRSGRTRLVVASAMSGTTNDLLEAAEMARDGRADEAVAQLDQQLERHRAAAHQLDVAAKRVAGLPEETPQLTAFLDACFSETRDRLRGIALLGELTARSHDAVAATGELVSSALLAAATGGRWFDAREVMTTDDDHGAASVSVERLEEAVASRLAGALAPDAVVVTQGYIGRAPDGATSTLGRGGSDYSAALFGATLAAEEIEIWTDVDGMLTADPRIVDNARQLPEASFEEASELAYFGAKVLHPATIRPALLHGIPVRVLNTFHPERPGTLIRRADATAASNAPVRAVATRTGITVVLVSNPRMLMAHGWSGRVFEVFGRHRVSVDLIATSEVSISLTVDDASRLDEVVSELRAIAEVTVLREQAIVAVVGSGMRHRPGVAARAFGALGEINVVMISMGASDLNLSFVVGQDDAHPAIKRLHREFFEEMS